MNSVASINNAAEAKNSAKAAGLRYISDQKPGFTRKHWGRGFRYFDILGKPLKDKEQLDRILALAIPPAWTEVWISPDSKSHLQASGRDTRHRKQYLYHERWSTVRNETKFERMIAFAKILPKIRKQVAEHLALSGLPREKVLATLVRLLETTSIRIGNEENAKTNQSFGLTTLQNRHVNIQKATLRFRFRGKSGVFHEIDLQNRKLARIVKQCQDLPGQDLFQYIDEKQELHGISSTDVNQYLQEITEDEFSAKDFRTWAGTLYAVMKWQEKRTEEEPSKRGWAKIVKEVAAHLGNTPTVCRKYYIHPIVFEHYQQNFISQKIISESQTSVNYDLTPQEQTVLQMLTMKSAS